MVNIKKVEIYHSNVFFGKESFPKDFSLFLKENLNFDLERNPDFLTINKDIFGIEDVRSLKDWMVGRPMVGEQKVLLLISSDITVEAQNAFLKILEEPPKGTYIFINIDNYNNLIATFLSRVRIFNNQEKKDIDVSNKASVFLKSNIKERVLISSSFKKGDNDRKNIKDFIKEMEYVAGKERLDYRSIELLIKAKSFVSKRGTSPKIVLDWLTSVL